MASYLKDRKQAFKIKGYIGVFKLIISGVPQASILGPILFNIFINDLFYLINSENLHNFADDNTLSASVDNFEALIPKLEELAEIAISWMDHNGMIANPTKFHAILFSKDRTDNSGKTLKDNMRSQAKLKLTYWDSKLISGFLLIHISAKFAGKLLSD